MLRHALAVLLLPFVVTVAIPAYLISQFGTGQPGPWQQAAGVLLFAAGLSVFTWCVSLFVCVGRGTLAPWDPTTALVAVGPYRYVRNPMITGVAAMLFGQAVYFSSIALGIFSAVFVALNHIYFVYSEEPGLEQRFGDGYRQYKASVPRWLPRGKR
ncbi:MAG: isoprenylcysteine carboxylmethyltransferase family protein [Anaerolineales bacterium]|jgi:protein-S-isoprenylcysteine O-methyltransferase Ste14|nr:isoprenylcysteine carboxylmethyltransferase family protein [Anaerolineales bacterium]MBX3006022.1 isoprenylcysteine carboxylmethyltransferase family protein [Anaerolineales bacterium]